MTTNEMITELTQTVSDLKRDVESLKEDKNYLYDNSWKEEIDEFSDCILNDNPVENGTSYDALKVMEMIFDVYKADSNWWKKFNNS